MENRFLPMYLTHTNLLFFDAPDTSQNIFLMLYLVYSEKNNSLLWQHHNYYLPNVAWTCVLCLLNAIILHTWANSFVLWTSYLSSFSINKFCTHQEKVLLRFQGVKFKGGFLAWHKHISAFCRIMIYIQFLAQIIYISVINKICI